MAAPENIPVIVGVGQVNDRDDVHDSLDLMAEALLRADRDGGGGWIARAGSLATIAQISFAGLGDTAAGLAARLGIAPRHCAQTPHPTGESPLQLLHEAGNRIGTGEIDVALIAGAEALRTAAACRGPVDAMRDTARKAMPGGLARYGLVAPTDIYPLYENATRAAWGQTLDEAQAESGELWAGMSRVSAANPDAWLRRTMTADAIVTPSPGNRMIAFPYTKLLVANAAVNMGAAFIVTNLARAREAGLSDDRIVHLGASAAGHEPPGITDRDRYDRSASMDASLKGVLARNEVSIPDIACVELYSCFPCIPKMARRILDWPVDRPISVYGGLTFGGGPIGNAMSHAVAAMVQLLRGTGSKGLVFANGGYATHSHALLLSGQPTGASFPHDADIMANCRHDAVPPLAESYVGPARIETYTVFYARDGSVRDGVVIARTPANARVIAAVSGDDLHTVQSLVGGVSEAVGSDGTIAATDNGLTRWTAH